MSLSPNTLQEVKYHSHGTNIEIELVLSLDAQGGCFITDFTDSSDSPSVAKELSLSTNHEPTVRAP